MLPVIVVVFTNVWVLIETLNVPKGTSAESKMLSVKVSPVGKVPELCNVTFMGMLVSLCTKLGIVIFMIVRE